MIHHRLTDPTIASHPKYLNLNLCTLRSQQTCVQNLMTMSQTYTSTKKHIII